MSTPESNIIIPAQTLPHVIVPFPLEITVHLGSPDDKSALNVTVPYIDYIKNVASSELYPTWPEEALRANIYAIISTTMNRVFTEWYRSRGYDFDITSSPQYDQAYVPNRGIFSNISDLTNEIFDQYITRSGHVEPLFAVFCDGRQVQCNGLLQWGTVDLANQGYDALDILKYYYGNDILLVESNIPTTTTETYPGSQLKLGDSGISVFRMQHSLNKISENYPAIPTVDITGYFDEKTEEAVKVFQEVFGLPVTGIVDMETWYFIRRIYVAVERLYELNTEGLSQQELLDLYANVILEEGNRPVVGLLQYFLNVLSSVYPAIPAVTIDSYYGPETTDAVKVFQEIMGLPPSGIVDLRTWAEIYKAVYAILTSVPVEDIYLPLINFMGMEYREGMNKIYPGILILDIMLNYLSTKIPEIPAVKIDGNFSEDKAASVRVFQELYGLEPTGVVDAQTWNMIMNIYRNFRYAET
ncbi:MULTISPECIES: peptidoglycan-binding domain-containing protein [unclassified Sedimentibacter]|uniref:peptidoglycan-binding domain-containing protein n=1 Tax=unclassified Sedimentibacter TaxID=2649220 RepID=UPI0027E00638|nr:peptidoglycan-binding protein [Sedimentibacter sp. MB35-C1]WMJ76706.1 peptidoglycan-binding protein [Sedimentibacter sp. MB35-C1]